MLRISRCSARRSILLAAVGGVLAVSSFARAQEPPTAAASSDATTFVLSAFGQDVTAGRAHSEASTAPSAAASGMGLDNPLVPVALTVASAVAEGEMQGSSQPTCAAPLPGDLPLIGVDLVCSAATAGISGGVPSSNATAGVVGVDLNLLGAVADTPLTTLTATLGVTLDQLVAALGPVLGPIDQNSGLGLQETLGDLFAAVLGDTDLVNLDVGNVSVSTNVVGNQLVSSCRSDGATVTALDPLPANGVDLGPVLRITLGPVETSVSIDLGTGTLTASSSPVAVRVSAPALGIDLPVGPGQSVEVPLPDPLGTTTVSLAGPSTTTAADGSTVVAAPALGLHLLDSPTLGGGVLLDLSACSSRGLATVAQSPTTLTPTTLTPAGGATRPRAAGAALADTGGARSGTLLYSAVAAAAALGVRRLRVASRRQVGSTR
jgi:hypothetical protein